MTLDRLVNLLVTITLIEMMVLIGLRVTFAEIAETAKRRSLLVRAGVANYLLVPALAIVLLALFGADPMIAAGFLVLAVCPGAPFGPPFVAIARANVPQAVGLMAALAASSAILAPLLLQGLLPWIGGGDALRIDAIGIVRALIITQLLPLLCGVALRHFQPQLADKLIGPLDLVSKILNLSLAALILFTQFQMLADIRLRGFAGMLMLLAGSLVIGWVTGQSAQEGRRTLALTTSLRNVGVGLVIVTGSFPGTPAVSAALAYGIVEVLGSLLLAMWWGRRPSAHLAPSPSPDSARQRDTRAALP
ncbi:MAG: bile acid:sodium symporter family protein [Xanthobacteraceae bacterium]